MIHNSSVIDKEAKIGKNVKIGPFCYIGSKVHIGDGAVLVTEEAVGEHVVTVELDLDLHVASDGLEGDSRWAAHGVVPRRGIATCRCDCDR